MTSLLITKNDAKSCTNVTVPVTLFETPFIGWSIPELKAHYIGNVTDPLKFTANTFIVLDKRTEQDETCQIVSASILEDPEEEDSGAAHPMNKLSTARADFYVALQTLVPVEVMTYALNEGPGSEWRAAGDEFLYTKERVEKVEAPVVIGLPASRIPCSKPSPV